MIARRYIGAANFLTVFRLCLLPVVLYLLTHMDGGNSYRWIALGMLIFMQFTDIADGFLARYGQKLYPIKNLFGAVADPVADKLYINSTYLTLSSIGLFPWWGSIFFAVKDASLMLAWALVTRIKGKVEVKPNFFGKAADSIQAILIFCIVGGINQAYVQPAAIFVACCVVAAAASYALRDAKIAN